MRPFVKALLVLFLAALWLPLAAQSSDTTAVPSVQRSAPAASDHAWKADEVPMPHYKDAQRWTSNPDGVLSAAAVAFIDSISNRLYAKDGTEMVFVAVNHIDGDMFEWGRAVFEKHKFGKAGEDRGLLVVLSAADREYRFFPGRGLEEALTDGICGRIGRSCLVPHAKKGDWDNALAASAAAIGELLTGGDPDEILGSEDDDTGGLFGGLVLVGTMLGAGGMAAYISRPKCPKCGKRMKKVKRELIKSTHYNHHYLFTYRCPKCGETITKEQLVSRGTGTVIGGGGGMFSGGSGGSSGGSFGGGSYGGGGAGGRF